MPPDLERSDGDVEEAAFMGLLRVLDEGFLVGVEAAPAAEEKDDGDGNGDQVCALSLAQSRGSAPGELPCCC